jgi:hypothetical protein
MATTLTLLPGGYSEPLIVTRYAMWNSFNRLTNAGSRLQRLLLFAADEGYRAVTRMGKLACRPLSAGCHCTARGGRCISETGGNQEAGMPSTAAEPVHAGLERAELQAVLASQLFVRSPTLAHLLSYLCEKKLAGETDQVKEYSIALDVFGRQDSFDQDTDSIVRVQANRLRKRLAEYYSGEGATHALRIAIPIGQYVPSFERVETPTGPQGPPRCSQKEHRLQRGLGCARFPWGTGKVEFCWRPRSSWQFWRSAGSRFGNGSRHAKSWSHRHK